MSKLCQLAQLGWGATQVRDPQSSGLAHVLVFPFQGKYLSRSDYLDLGVRRSIFTDEDRPAAYDLFEKYRRYVDEKDFFDLNLEAQRRLPLCEPQYDFVVVDEVQDLTNTQLNMVLQLLRAGDRFILCGDSNQIVHPNFFSWSALKSMFYEQHKDSSGRGRTIERVLASNYRNYKHVTALANRLLMIKHARFGSIDRESNYLVKSVSLKTGTVELLPSRDKILRDIDTRTSRSMHTAVLVPRQEDKAEAAKHFKTPLIFSIQEAKGLEYPNIVLYHFVSLARNEFNTIVEGVDHADLKGDLAYSRARDKHDKSLEAYKFFINALYVAMTRAVENLYIIEQDTGHRLYGLLQLNTVSEETGVRTDQSSTDDWKDEARRLAAQGKEEQAAAIRRDILETREVEWDVTTPKSIEALKRKALDPQHYNKKDKQLLFDYALTYHLPQYLTALVDLKFGRAKDPQKHTQAVFKSYTRDYLPGAAKELHRKLDRYGVDFRNPLNQTPLMLASRMGDVALTTELVEAGGDRDALDNWGQNALQIALGEALLEGSSGLRHIGQLYPLLAPPSLKLRINNRLIKLDSHLMEFFIVQSMLALFPRILRYKATRWYYAIQKPSFESGDFFYAFQEFPEYVLLARRKKRAYISSILSKNECFRDGPYNRQLFLRVTTGHYILNPLMDVFVGDAWLNVYDLLGLACHAAEGLPVADKFLAYLHEARPAMEAGRKPPPFLKFFSVDHGF